MRVSPAPARGDGDVVDDDEKNSCRMRETRCGGICAAVAESPPGGGGVVVGEGGERGNGCCCDGGGGTSVDLPLLPEAACWGLLGLCLGGIWRGM